MAKRARKRKCPCCGVFFTPDYRNQRRQRYCCSKPECRKAWALKKTDPFLLKRTAPRSAQYLSFFLSAIRL
jgi:hypothetical protein